jgi:hypothetical protein
MSVNAVPIGNRFVGHCVPLQANRRRAGPAYASASLA